MTFISIVPLDSPAEESIEKEPNKADIVSKVASEIDLFKHYVTEANKSNQKLHDLNVSIFSKYKMKLASCNFIMSTMT